MTGTLQDSLCGCGCRFTFVFLKFHTCPFIKTRQKNLLAIVAQLAILACRMSASICGPASIMNSSLHSCFFKERILELCAHEQKLFRKQGSLRTFHGFLRAWRGRCHNKEGKGTLYRIVIKDLPLNMVHYPLYVHWG